MLAEVKWLRNALGYVEDGVKSDSLDTALAQLLEQEARNVSVPR